MDNQFIMQVKSTIEYLAAQIAASMPTTTDQFELDDTVGTATKMESPTPAIVWQLTMMDPDPVDPLYRGMFAIGAKTTEDAGNVLLMQLVSKVHTMFEAGTTLDVADYTLATPVKTGVLYIISPALDPQQFDAASGVRLMAVSAKAIRLS